MKLSREDIRAGFEALRSALGDEKAKYFLAAVAQGALDDRIPSRVAAFVRQNPEAFEALAKATGTFFAELVKPRSRGVRKAIQPVAQAAIGLFGPGRDGSAE